MKEEFHVLGRIWATDLAGFLVVNSLLFWLKLICLRVFPSALGSKMSAIGSMAKPLSGGRPSKRKEVPTETTTQKVEEKASRKAPAGKGFTAGKKAFATGSDRSKPVAVRPKPMPVQPKPKSLRPKAMPKRSVVGSGRRDFTSPPGTGSRGSGDGVEVKAVQGPKGSGPPMFRCKSKKAEPVFGPEGKLLFPEQVLRLQAEAPCRDQEAEAPAGEE